MFANHKNSFLFYHGWGEDTPFGKWFGRGFGSGGFGPARYFERGVLKFLILDLIKQQPRHGYDIIQELEKKFHGFYSPSAGSVYPILQLLEDQGYVLSDQKNGKKVYTITIDGEKFLEENKAELEQMHEHHFNEKHNASLHELRDEVRETAQLLFHQAKQGALNNPERVKELKAAFVRFRDEVETILTRNDESEKENK